MMWEISVDGEGRGGRRGNVAFFVSTTNVKSERKNWGPMENTLSRSFRSGKD
jgi:hypothetical protein